MQALYVHGLGRSPLSGAGLMWRLRKHGVITSSIFYSATFESAQSIEARLRRKIIEVANQGNFVLIGHSLGGVLIRAALASLPNETRLPSRVFLLGSPTRPSRIAKYLHKNWLFRLATRDCGDLLSSESRMEQIAPCSVPTTSVVGIRGLYGRFSPFGSEENDGVVAASEVSAPWISEEIKVRVIHTYLPSNRKIAQLIIERLPQDTSPVKQNELSHAMQDVP